MIHQQALSMDLVYACTFDGCGYQMFDASFGDVEEHWFLTHRGINVDRLARALAVIGVPADRRNASAVDISCAYASTDADE